MHLSDGARKGLLATGVAAAAAMAALSPLQIAGAEPTSDTKAPVTVTATVTAHVAPDQCDPVPDGKLPQQAVDYASDGAPITTNAPSPTKEAKPVEDGVNPLSGHDVPLAPASSDSTTTSDKPRAAEEGGKPVSNGPFDPYLCEATPSTSVTSSVVTVTPAAPGPALEDLPGASPTQLPGYQGSMTDDEVGGGVELGEVGAKPTVPQQPGGQQPIVRGGASGR